MPYPPLPLHELKSLKFRLCLLLMFSGLTTQRRVGISRSGSTDGQHALRVLLFSTQTNSDCQVHASGSRTDSRARTTGAVLVRRESQPEEPLGPPGERGTSTSCPQRQQADPFSSLLSSLVQIQRLRSYEGLHWKRSRKTARISLTRGVAGSNLRTWPSGRWIVFSWNAPAPDRSSETTHQPLR